MSPTHAIFSNFDAAEPILAIADLVEGQAWRRRARKPLHQFGIASCPSYFVAQKSARFAPRRAP